MKMMPPSAAGAGKGCGGRRAAGAKGRGPARGRVTGGAPAAKGDSSRIEGVRGAGSTVGGTGEAAATGRAVEELEGCPRAVRGVPRGGTEGGPEVKARPGASARGAGVGREAGGAGWGGADSSGNTAATGDGSAASEAAVGEEVAAVGEATPGAGAGRARRRSAGERTPREGDRAPAGLGRRGDAGGAGGACPESADEVRDRDADRLYLTDLLTDGLRARGGGLSGLEEARERTRRDGGDQLPLLWLVGRGGWLGEPRAEGGVRGKGRERDLRGESPPRERERRVAAAGGTRGTEERALGC